MISFILYTSFIRLFPIIHPTLALTLQPIQDVSNFRPSAPPTNETSQVTVPASLTFGSLTVAAESPHPTCNGGLLGFDLNSQSCLEAWNSISPKSKEVTFGDRFVASEDFDVKLPRRFSGPDGTCVIDVLHKDGVVGDTSSYTSIAKAAENVYGHCIARGGQRAQGGWIRDVGRRGNLVVVLSLYEPRVSCFDRRFYMATPDPTMQRLLANIPVGTVRQRFGPEGEPGVQVVLPATNYSPPIAAPWTERVKLTVDVDHRDAVGARWFDIWAGAVAVTAMCVVRGYGGVSAQPGGLSVTLDKVPDLGVSGKS